MVLMVLRFIWSWYLIVNKILSGFTMFLVNWLTIVFSSLLKQSTYEWLSNVSMTIWLWKPHSIVSLHPMVFANLPFKLKGHPHFLVPVDLHTNLSLYYLYFFPLFSLPNITCSFFYLFLTYEWQPQSHAPFPHIEPNLKNHRTLEKSKRIGKIIQ